MLSTNGVLPFTNVQTASRRLGIIYINGGTPFVHILILKLRTRKFITKFLSRKFYMFFDKKILTKKMAFKKYCL